MKNPIYRTCKKKQTEVAIPDLHKNFLRTFEKLELLRELVGSSLETPSG
jgi:hypothetical protein